MDSYEEEAKRLCQLNIEPELDYENFNKLFKKMLKIRWQHNIETVMKDANKKQIPNYIKTKIINESRKKGLSYKNILNFLKTHLEYASTLAKDPLKQNLAEIVQLELLNKKFNNKIIKLPTSGKGAVYLCKSQLISGNNIDKYLNVLTTKSMDFYNESEKTYYYAKYINQAGGAQDNQYNDIKSMIKEINKYYSNKIYKKNKSGRFKY